MQNIPLSNIDDISRNIQKIYDLEHKQKEEQKQKLKELECDQQLEEIEKIINYYNNYYLYKSILPKSIFPNIENLEIFYMLSGGGLKDNLIPINFKVNLNCKSKLKKLGYKIIDNIPKEYSSLPKLENIIHWLYIEKPKKEDDK